MTRIKFGSSALAICVAWLCSSAAYAQTQDAEAEASTNEGDIVVSARRRDEIIQDVPSTLTAVSGATIEKLNFRQIEDIASVTPGFTTTGPSAGGGIVSLRGLTFDGASGANSSIDFYLNEVPNKGAIVSNLFDIEQIEVLRGPQGVLRGRSVPSGAITLTTRRPDDSQFGGYAQGTATSLNGYNLQGALNVPIVQDVIAVRVAGALERNDADRVRSLNNGLDPRVRRLGTRVSLLVEPDDDFNLLAMWQHDDNEIRIFSPVAGPGSGANGPPLLARDRRSVMDGPNNADAESDIISIQANWNVMGHVLSYVGGYYVEHMDTLRDSDIANLIPGVTTNQSIITFDKQLTQELRISSASDGTIEYSAGVYYARRHNGAAISQPSYLSGAFGRPGLVPTIGTFFPKYVLNADIDIDTLRKELSFFGNVIVHITPDTELSVGGRYISHSNESETIYATSPGFIALPASLLGVPSCAAANLQSAPFPGFCDRPLPAGNNPPLDPGKIKDNRFIYNVTLSHKFNDAILLYANVGSSFRPGPVITGIQNASNAADLNRLIYLGAEKSTTFEAGVKATLFGGRGRMNLSAFHQKFKDLINTGPSVPYLQNTGSGQPSVSQYAFSYNADAKITGIDFDASFQITPQWTLAGSVSWAKGKIDDDEIPCRDANFDGVQDTGTPTAFPAGTNVAYCVSNGSVSRQPRWSGNLQSEFTQPVNDKMSAYVRGLFSYRPRNPYQDDGFVVDSYGLLNVYAGMRATDSHWDLGLFVKNVTGTKNQLSRSTGFAPSASGTGSFADPGYRTVSFTMPRELGVSLRIALGSR